LHIHETILDHYVVVGLGIEHHLIDNIYLVLLVEAGKTLEIFIYSFDLEANLFAAFQGTLELQHLPKLVLTYIMQSSINILYNCVYGDESVSNDRACLSTLFSVRLYFVNLVFKLSHVRVNF